MILQRWKSNLEKIKNLEQKHKGLKTVESLQEIIRRFEGATEQLGNKIESYKFCKQYFNFADNLKGILKDQGVETNLKKVKENFSNNKTPESLKDTNDFDTFLDHCRIIGKELDDAVNFGWKNFKDTCYPSREDSVMLEKQIEIGDPKNKKIIEEFKAIETKFYDLLSKRERSQENLKVIKKLGGDLQEKARALKDQQKNIPNSVKDFLNSYRDKGWVPLDLFNEEVRQWLTKNNLENKYRITSTHG